MSHFDETSGLSVGAPPEGQKDDDTPVKGRTSAWENQVTESTDHAIPPVFCGTPLCSDTPVREPSTGDLALSTSIYHARPPVPSVMSMQSGQSTGELPTFRVESTPSTRVHHSRPPSSVSSVSLHSDYSMREPPGFAEELSQSTSAYTDRPGGVLCSTCPKKAFKSCLTCVASFCEHHVRQHYTAPALQRHKLVEAIEDLEERLCQQHYRELEFYCKTDQTSVCALCISRQHKGHDIEELSEHGKESELNLTPQMKESELTTQQNLPAPKPITFKFVKTDSVCLSWGAPEGLTRPEFAVTWRSEVDSGNLIVPGQEVDIQNLTPGEMYTFSVATLYDGSQSVCVSETVRTEIPAPEDIKLNATLTSVSVSWSKPEGVDEVSYLLTLSSGGGYMKTVNTKSLQCCFSDLEVGTEYSISASTVQKKGFQGKPILKTIIISVPVPEELKVVSVSASSANLTWSPPHGMGQIPHSFLVSYSSDGTEKSISTDSCSTDIMHLQPGTDYTVRVQTKLKNERLSEALRVEIQTVVPAPDKLKVVSVRVTSASLTWSPPHGMGQIPHSFLVTYSSDGTEKSILADSCSTEIMHLQPGTDYTVRVQTKLKNKRLSEAARAEIQTVVPAPDKLEVVSVSATSANLTWSPPHGMGQIPHSFLVTYNSDGTERSISTDSCSTDITHLQPGTDYTVKVQTKLKSEKLREAVTTEVHTDVPAPENLKVDSVTATSACLTWSPANGMGQIPHSFLVTYSVGGTEKIISTELCRTEILDVEPGTAYTVSVQTKLKNKRLSKVVTTDVHTGELSAGTSEDDWKVHIEPIPIKKIIHGCKEIKKIPSCYLLPTKTKIIAPDVRQHTYKYKNKRQITRDIKTILLVGETGAGKTTLVNTMVNYMFGIKWEDRVWFQITEEDDLAPQVNSVTTSVNVYEVLGLENPFFLRVIDTPGYGSTEGIEQDWQIGMNLHSLFRSEDGIHEINAVGLVVKSGQNRLTQFHRYIFNSILSLFGKDIEKNMVVFITHSHGLPDKNVISAIKEAEVAYTTDANGEPLHFLFNNCQTENYVNDENRLQHSFWNLGYKSMEKFAGILAKSDTKELKMTTGVLRTRKRLKACVRNLQDAIRMEELKQEELQQIQEALEKNETECEVYEPYKEKVPVESSWWHWTTEATSCKICKENCHYPGCWWVKDLSWCSAMTNNRCTVCTNKCHFSDHVKENKRYVIKTRKVKKTTKEYEEQNNIQKVLNDTRVKKSKLLEKAYNYIMELDKIALKMDSMSTCIDFLIKKTEDREKVQILEELKEKIKASHKMSEASPNQEEIDYDHQFYYLKPIHR